MKCPNCGMILQSWEQHSSKTCASFRQYHEELLNHRVREILADTYFDRLKRNTVLKETEDQT